jgi:predicted outer membrane protein
MLCAHGLMENECPHCRMMVGMKPKIQLVKVGPKELPIPMRVKDDLQKAKDLQYDDLYSNNMLSRHMPQRLTRNFNLSQSLSNSSPSLFQERIAKITEKHQNRELELNEMTDIIDLKAKFTKKI